MLGSDFIKAHLARIAWADGGQEGLSGALACAFVIRARVRAGWYNGDWLQVLSHHQDYAAVDRPLPNELPDPRHYAFSLLLQEVDGIFAGSREDDVTQPANKTWLIKAQDQADRPIALYYANLSDSAIKESFLETITRNHDNHKLVAQVGLLHFFS